MEGGGAFPYRRKDLGGAMASPQKIFELGALKWRIMVHSGLLVRYYMHQV